MANNCETFTDYERNSLLTEIIMQEGPKIDSVIGLYGFLHREKEHIIKSLVNSDDHDTQALLFSQLDSVKLDLMWAEEFINTKLLELKN